MSNDRRELDSPRDADPGPPVSGLRRFVYLAVGGLFFVLGFLGAILPGLPATPFLLLTSYFLVRSSPKLNQRLLNSRLFGPILTDWQVHGGVRRDVKIKSIVVVTAVVALSLYITSSRWPWTAVVIGLAIIGVIVILKLPTARMPEEIRDELDEGSSSDA